MFYCLLFVVHNCTLQIWFLTIYFTNINFSLNNQSRKYQLIVLFLDSEKGHSACSHKQALCPFLLIVIFLTYLLRYRFLTTLVQHYQFLEP